MTTTGCFTRIPRPGVVPWSFCREFGVGAVTGYHSHAADIIQYALGMERSGPVEFIHPKDGPYPTLTCRYANGTLLHLVEDWQDVKRLYHAVPDTARLAGNFGGVFVGEKGWITSMTTGGPIEGGPGDLLAAMGLDQREPDREGNNHHANWLRVHPHAAAPEHRCGAGASCRCPGSLDDHCLSAAAFVEMGSGAEEFPDDPTANRLLSRASRG